MPQTQLSGPRVNDGIPMPVTVMTYLIKEDAWIIGAVDGGFLKMVKLRVTGSASFDWMSTKYDSNYNDSCLDGFSESCFVGRNTTENQYPVILVAEPEGKAQPYSIMIIV